MASPIAKLAPAAFLINSSFLSFSSQYLFRHIDPGPLDSWQSVVFSTEILLLYICYYRSVQTNPGYAEPNKGLAKKGHEDGDEILRRPRWCKKCDAPKPPRAHHCKICKRCVMKMDHHCPWTANCVAHRSFPHFIRFLLYSTVGMAHLEVFIFTRLAVIWEDRKLASSLGPSPFHLIHMMVLTLVNSLSLFGVSILLLPTLWCLGCNTTRIEGWEMERHESLLRRARARGGYVYGPGGIKVKIVRHEFPYDIGIFSNIAQGMGSRNPLAWFWPLAASPITESGYEFEENDFNEPGLSWPPPDPDKLPRPANQVVQADAFTHGVDELSNDRRLEAFKQRQKHDLNRRAENGVHLRSHLARSDPYRNDSSDEPETTSSGTIIWRNAEGETLDDYGVDEDAELGADDDSVPLSQLKALRKAYAR